MGTRRHYSNSSQYSDSSKYYGSEQNSSAISDYDSTNYESSVQSARNNYKEKLLTANNLNSSRIEDDHDSHYQASETASELDVTNPKELEYRAKIYLQNLKTFLSKKAIELRMAGKVKHPLTMRIAELHETVARMLLNKAFQPYLKKTMDLEDETNGVVFNDFKKVLQSFTFPGTSAIRTETVKFLFDLCSLSDDAEIHLNEHGDVIAKPHLLMDLIFGTPVINSVKKTRGITKIGKQLDHNEENEHGLSLKGFVDKIEAGREPVIKGPLLLPDAVQHRVNNASTQQKSSSNVITDANKLAVPLRWINRRSKAALSVPSNFDASLIQRSNQYPSYHLIKKHAFGMSTTHYSGNTIYALPSTPSKFSAPVSIGWDGKPRITNELTRGLGYIDGATIVYATAALGVIHNLQNNTQHFFDGHIDDITCIAVSKDYSLAATGCMGKTPVAHVWVIDRAADDTKSSLATLGLGFFDRGVCALEFSYDNEYLVGIGCDDNSMLGIFHIATGEIVAKTTALHSIPPAIKYVSYCPVPQYTEYISANNPGLCDVFGTAGENHARIWSFKRPSKGTPASLEYRKTVMGKAGAKAAKFYFCCGFAACDDKTYDYVAGGSNGMVYLWRKGVVVTTCQAFRGRVQSLIIVGSKIYCGGAGGRLKVFDTRTLNCLQEFALMKQSLTSLAKPRPKSASSINRTSARSGSAVGAQRPPLAVPKQDPSQMTSRDKHKANIADVFSHENLEKDADEDKLLNESGDKLVSGITFCQGSGRGYLIVTLATGKAVRVDLSSPSDSSGGSNNRPMSSSGMRPGTSSALGRTFVGRDLFHYHVGPLYGLAVDQSPLKRLIASVADDRKLLVWDAIECTLIAKTHTKSSCRCVHIDKTNCFIAVGSNVGGVTVFFLSDRTDKSGNFFMLDELAYRQDTKAECADIKFSPSNEQLAVGTHDDCIYVYTCQFTISSKPDGRKQMTVAKCILQTLYKFKGHSSTVSHIDWSIDGQLLQSSSNAYELLCWDISNGKMLTTINVADVKWKTRHCPIGFPLMGMWPLYSDGTEINSIDVSIEKGILATGNDEGGIVRLLNYPCVVNTAPAYECVGHSSHVMNVRFMMGGDSLMSVGGNDGTIINWSVVPDPVASKTDKFKP